jgi:hypothetical protein
VDAVRTALPELESLRDDPNAAPMRRARDVVGKPLFCFRHRSLQNCLFSDGFALL